MKHIHIKPDDNTIIQRLLEWGWTLNKVDIVETFPNGRERANGQKNGYTKGEHKCLSMYDAFEIELTERILKLL